MLKRLREWQGAFLAVLAAAAVVASAPIATAHETDQFTLPHGREFADIGQFVTGWVYTNIERGVARANQGTEFALINGAASEIPLGAKDEIVRAVNGAFPNAFDVIEGFERLANSSSLQRQHPGKIIGYKQQFTNIFQHVHLPIDPRQFFRIWHASTFNVFGVYLGSDKIGHFTDMGMNYYREYSTALKRGASEEQAVLAAIRLGTHNPLFGERGAVGLLSAGAYSNADLASNYVGFLFYKNLTDPVVLKGQVRPPMLVRTVHPNSPNGSGGRPRWEIAPHVRPDSDFFSWFISDHFNEALNPSYFEPGMREKIEKAMRSRTDVILARHCDEYGNRRPPEYFTALWNQLRTYYKQEYGHIGGDEEIITIADACYHQFPQDAQAQARDHSGWTPLHAAAALGDVARAQQLIRAGANVNAQVRSDESYSAEWGNTPLHYACRDGRVEMVELLLSHGADMNAANDRGQTPMHRGVGHAEVSAKLIRRGARLNARDALGRTLLHWAVDSASTETIQMMLYRGADPNLRDNFDRTPLHRAAQIGNADVAAMLLAHGVDPDARAEMGIRPAHLAAAGGHTAILQMLIDHGCRINAKDEFQRSPLHEASANGHVETATLLLARGADRDGRDAHRCTPLHLAARQRQHDVAAFLLNSGADANAISRTGKTPLHEAAFAADTPLVNLLLSHGADPNVRTRRGQSPADVASANGSRQLATLLRNTRQVMAGSMR